MCKFIVLGLLVALVSIVVAQETDEINFATDRAAVEAVFVKAADAVESDSLKFAKEQTLTLKHKAKAAKHQKSSGAGGDMTKLRNANAQTYKINQQTTVGLKAEAIIMESSKDYQTGYSNNYKSIKNIQVPFEYCPYEAIDYCDSTSKYRTIEGECNNLVFPWWGKSFTPYKRLLPALYDDGYNSPHLRSVVDAKWLPNARQIALEAMYPVTKLDIWTHQLTELAQFIFHDITFIARIAGDKYGTTLQCDCFSKNPDCLTIPIPYGDKYFAHQKCMTTDRSAASYKDFNCKMGEREQLNTVTGWLDLSNVYGNTEEDYIRLKTLSESNLEEGAGKGMLNWLDYPGVDNDLLPLQDSCANDKYPNNCFSTGDSRVNINYQLASLNVLWVREHNRIAKIIWALNPFWDNDKIFEEARRINIAAYQNIVYKEWLPITIGEYEYTSGGFKANYESGGQYSFDYDSSIFPAMFNEIAAAVGRYGHSMLSSWFTKANVDYYQSKQIRYEELVFNSKHAFSSKDGTEQIMRGMCLNRNEKIDTHLTDFVNNYMAENGTKFSLPAYNIMRGRDHGLQPYVEYRQLCGLKPVKHWDDLDNFYPEIVQKLRALYTHVQDIDLYVGVSAEIPLPNSLLGATSSCIMAKQFQQLKYGDRFWFEFGNDPYVRFKPNQLAEIRKHTYAKLLCDNMDFKTVLVDPLTVWNPHTNPFVNCDSVPGMDLTAWAVKQPSNYNKVYNNNYQQKY